MSNEHLYMIGHSAPISVQSYIEMHKDSPDTRHDITRCLESSAPHHTQHHRVGFPSLAVFLSAHANQLGDTFEILSRSKILLPKYDNLYMIIEINEDFHLLYYHTIFRISTFNNSFTLFFNI